MRNSNETQLITKSRAAPILWSGIIKILNRQIFFAAFHQEHFSILCLHCNTSLSALLRESKFLLACDGDWYYISCKNSDFISSQLSSFPEIGLFEVIK